jgi:hypothetical protein
VIYSCLKNQASGGYSCEGNYDEKDESFSDGLRLEGRRKLFWVLGLIGVIASQYLLV